MQDKHGSTRFPVFGTEVVKLFNSRYRIVVRCDVANRNEDWYYANRDSFWKDFGDLYTASLDVDAVDDGWNVRDGEAYPDMRLVSTEFGFLPTRPTPVLTFVYETLPSTFTQEVADKVDYELNGLRRVTRSVIAKDGATYTKVVGTDTISHEEHGQGLKTLTLSSAVEAAKGEGEGGFVRYIETWIEPGIISVRPVTEGTFSEVQQYVYQSIGKSPSTLHADSPLPKPNGDTLEVNASFYEPTVQNIEGFPNYTQLVTNIAATPSGALVHSKEQFFEIMEPGVMSTGFSTAYTDKSASAVIFPQATQQPRSYRKKASVKVYLTTSSTLSETEVAYTEEGIDWASMAFYNYYNNDENGTSSTSASWRAFPNYFVDAQETDTASASVVGSAVSIAASASAVKRGSTFWATTGNYRVILSEYEKGPDGTQYYLKTIVSFS